MGFSFGRRRNGDDQQPSEPGAPLSAAAPRVSVPMEIIASAPAQMGLSEIADWAARMERIGFDVIHIAETIHDPFTIAAMALTHTKHLTVRTSMALAFPRSPMIVAYAAWDLAKYSDGRFQLGIASQVRGNIVGRFSSGWSEPVSRLGDYIESLRAIFHAFQTGEPLNHEGKHYRFNRLQPYFTPARSTIRSRKSGPAGSTGRCVSWPANCQTASCVIPPIPTRTSSLRAPCPRLPRAPERQDVTARRPSSRTRTG